MSHEYPRNVDLTPSQVAEALGVSEPSLGKADRLHSFVPQNTTDGGQRRYGLHQVNERAPWRRPPPADRPILVTHMGIEPYHADRPSPFYSRGLGRGDEVLDLVAATAKGRHYGEDHMRYSGIWPVSIENVEMLLDREAALLADCAGWVHEGGWIEDVIEDVYEELGGRVFVIRPFLPGEAAEFLHTYIRPQAGPIVQIINR